MAKVNKCIIEIIVKTKITKTIFMNRRTIYFLINQISSKFICLGKCFSKGRFILNTTLYLFIQEKEKRGEENVKEQRKLLS